MKNTPVENLNIRTAVVRKADLGFILACDPKKEEAEVLHTISFKWKNGVFTRGEANFSAHTCCIIDVPEYGIVKVAAHGEYSVETARGVTAGNIFKRSQPKSKEPRYGTFWSVSEIGGKAYAVGHHGMIYRLDEPSIWTRADDGLPNSFGATAIAGFDASDMYAVGYKGELWHFNGKKWKKHDLPTNSHLHSVLCAEDGNVYAAGRNGVLLSGRNDKWRVLSSPTKDTLWDTEWYEGKLYVSTTSGVFWLTKGDLELLDFGEDTPKTCYHLSAAKDVMWSIGEKDIMSFDGKKWTRII